MTNCTIDNLGQLLAQHISIDDTTKVILSGGRGQCTRSEARKINMNGKLLWQITSYVNNKALHNNVESSELVEILAVEAKSFRQLNVLNLASTINIMISKKGKCSCSVSATGNAKLETSHNRSKQYMIAEGDDSAIMRELGVFTADNKIVASKRDKFKQINKFIEIVHHELKSYDKESIVITDFGCGKSYLTFLVYDYFSKLRNIDVSVYGYDLKEDVVNHCSALASKYNYDKLTFMTADIADQQKVNFRTDMMITLHACDTATDYALYNAITGGVKYIFSVPCCQHEVNNAINCSGDILLNDGLIKERFSALLTDSIRCELLRQCGYSVDVVEFVDFAHSPKNLLIRAKLDKKPKYNYEKVEKLLQNYNISQTLYNLLTKGD